MSDPVPTSLLKDCTNVLVPFLVELYSKSLRTGSVPAVFKAAYMMPLSKSDFDPSDVRRYRPISNLSVLSKLLERLVARQLLVYLTMAKLLHELQLAYRAYDSMETAVLKVLANIFACTGYRRYRCINATSIYWQHLTQSTMLFYRNAWRRHTALAVLCSAGLRRISAVASRPSAVACLLLMPQGCPVWNTTRIGPWTDSVLTLHADLSWPIEHHDLHPHMYVDDTQIYGFCHQTKA